MSTDDSPVGRRCLSFVVRGPWGHFRRIEGNIVKQTYRVMPRTTVAGLVAAMLGYDRDAYYGLFAEGESLVAVEPTTELRTINLPMNTLSTASEDMTTLNSYGKLSVTLPDPSKLRQQHNYEVLVEPEYRIDLWLAAEDAYADLKDRLESRTSYYVPSLGLSEHLAEVEFRGEHEIRPGPSGRTDVTSTVPDATDRVNPVEGERYEFEQSPGFMERDDGGRTTTGFVSYAYNPAGEDVRVSSADAYEVDGRTVMFA